MGKALKTAGTIIGGAVLMATGVGALAGMQVTAMGIAGVGTMSIANLQLMSAGLMAAGSMLDKPKSTASGSPSEWTSNPDQGIPFLFGRMGVAGKIVHRDEYGPDNRLQGIVTIYSGAGPVKSFQGFTADELPVSFESNGGTAIGKYRRQMWRSWRMGAQPDTALSLPTGLDGGAVMPMWGASYRLSGKACDLLTMQMDSKFSVYPTGEPKPIQVLEGVFGYDPRYDDTYPGGAGPCRYGVRSTYRYINDPITAALNWALGMIENGQVVGGIGASLQGVDLPAFVEAANIADANAWTVAAWPDTSEDASVVLDELLEAGGAKRSRVAGKISCVSRGAPRPSIVTITRRDTAGAIELDTGASRFNRLNTITPVIMSEAHKWKHAPMDPVSFASLVSEDGGKRSDQIKYRFVSKVKQGAELAAYDILDAREPFAGTIPLLPHLRRLKPGDCFDIDEPGFMLDGVKMLVLSRSYDARTGEVRIAFRSETDSKHPLALGKTTTMPEYPGLTVPDPTEVTGPLPEDWTIVVRPPAPDGTQLPGFDLTGVVSNATADAMLIYWREVVEGENPDVEPPFFDDDGAILPGWNDAGTWPPTTRTLSIQGPQPGSVVWLAIRYRRGNNYSAPVFAGPKTAPGLISGDTTHLNGTPVTEITNRLQSVEAVAATAQQGVADLELVYGDTVSAAESALAAGNAANLAVLKAGEAGDAATASNVSAGIAATKATEAGNSATAANAAKVAAEAAQDTADAKATASATSAASAAASATNAETSATAASGSATTAATKAGEASTFAGQASSSKDAAAGSASSAAASAVTASTASGTAATARDAAIGARNDAQAAAATATTQASSASAAAASASISANLAASIGTRSLNKNSIFADWTAALPATWSQWSGTAGTTYAKVAGINGSPNAVKVGSAAGDPAGIVQTGNGAFGATGGEYLVMEADVRLVSGSMVGAGLYVERYNAAGSAQTGAALTYNFATDKDASGVVRGAGVAGQTYRFSKLVDARAADTAQYVVFALTRFGGFGAAAAGEIEWRRASIRAATPEEIAAGVVLPGVEAQLAITAAVAADAQTRLSTVRFDVTGGAGGDPFEVALRADASGSLGMLSATALRFRNFIGGLAVDVMRMIDGYVHILGPLYIGPNREIEIEPFTPSINWSMGTARLAIGKLPNDNLLFWFGPNVTAANMRKNNAALWLDRGGSAYFGGTLSAGVLRNGLTVTSLASNTTADTGRFGSNGGTITTTLSYSAATSAVYYDGATSPLPRPADTNGATSAAVRLDRSINGGALTAVQTLNVSGTWSDTVPVDGYVQGQGWRHEYSATMGGSLTYTDPQAVAQDRQYKATITARADGPRPIGSQTLSVVCIEA